jgi:hypothetical protein
MLCKVCALQTVVKFVLAPICSGAETLEFALQFLMVPSTMCCETDLDGGSNGAAVLSNNQATDMPFD